MTMQETLKQNKIRYRQIRLERERQERKEKTISAIIIFTLILVLSLVMTNYRNAVVRDCIELGHTQNYCEEGF